MAQSQRLNLQHGSLIGRSKEVKAIQSSIRKAKVSSQFIFIQGDSGTGKSKLASYAVTTPSQGVYQSHAKFDEGGLQQVHPVDVFMSALSDLCQNLDEEVRMDVVTDLKKTLSSTEREVLRNSLRGLGDIFWYKIRRNNTRIRRNNTRMKSLRSLLTTRKTRSTNSDTR